MQQPFPNRTDVIIIGGGIIGCSIAYHLSKAGFEDVILLERKKLTSGTTWHAAGLLGLVRSSENQTRLLQYAAEFFSRLEEETGQSTGFVRKGTIYVALNAARLEVLQRTVAYANYLGIKDARMLEAEEVADCWPLLSLEGVLGASLIPGTSQLNPVDATQALAKGAKAGGVRIYEDTRVDEIIVRGRSAVGVRVGESEISASRVVMACGMWTRLLGLTVGASIPLHAAEHFYIVSDPIPGITRSTPAMFCADERAYYKEDAGKLLVGTFEKQATPWATNGIPEHSEFESLGVDLDRYAEFLELATKRVPILNSAGIRTFFAGPESFTPDGRELMGETPEIKNLFVCAGFNSHGIMSSAGAGKVMAHWIKERYPPFAIANYNIVRMMRYQGSRRYLFDRTTESMGLVMDIPWPGKQMLTARGIRRVPIHFRHVQAHAEFGERYGWEIPLWYHPADSKIEISEKMGQQDWYPTVRSECHATRDAVAFYDQSNYTKILVQGRDASSFLNWICANEIDVASRKVVYTQWLNPRGGIEADVTVTRLAPDSFLILSAPPSQVRDKYWLEMHRSPDLDVTITDVTSAYAMFGLMGPKSRQLLASLTDADLANASFPFSTTREIDIGYANARATRLTYVGELGFELVISAEMAEYVYDEILRAGDDYGLCHAGNYAHGACRLERGYRHFGHDISEDDSPLEAGLSFAVAFQKRGGFLGRDALMRKRELGTAASRLVQVRLNDCSSTAPILQHDEIIWRGGRRVGVIRSGGWGFRLEASLGMGYIQNPDAANTTTEWIMAGQYEVEVALRRFPCEIQIRPFYDPSGERIRM